MNREQAKKLLPIIAAFAEGKEIQCFNNTYPSGGWFHVENPEWKENCEYRIKPEPVVVEKWAAANRLDGRIHTFGAEQSARNFVKEEITGEWVAFPLRGTYER